MYFGVLWVKKMLSKWLKNEKNFARVLQKME